MEYIINSDPTLKYLIIDADIDWNNEFQVDLRCKAIFIALAKYIDKKYK